MKTSEINEILRELKMFNPPPKPIMEVDPSSDLLYQAEIKELMARWIADDIETKDYIIQYRKLAKRRPLTEEELDEYVKMYEETGAFS